MRAYVSTRRSLSSPGIFEDIGLGTLPSA